MSAKSKTLVLIRHAHRDTTDRALDNGLSEKGKKQAAALTRYYTQVAASITGVEDASNSKAKGEKPRIFSSAKKRCVETVTGIAREAGVRVEVLPELVEQHEGEDSVAFKARVLKFIEKWRSEKYTAQLTIICSHGDWLPLAIVAACGARVDLKKGSWAEIKQEGRNKPKLEWLIQSVRSR